MSTTTDQPRMSGDSSSASPQRGVGGPAAGRSRPSLRLAAKLARREVRRRPWRAVLVIMLVALPTWVMFNTAIDTRTVDAVNNSPGFDFGSDLVASFSDGSPEDESVSQAGIVKSFDYGPPSAMTAAEVEAALPTGSTVQRVVGARTSILTENDKIEAATFVKIDLATDAAAAWAPLIEGRPPEYGEVALGKYLARRLGVGVGDTLRLRQPEGQWRVVGITGSMDDRLLAVRDFDESKLAVDAGELLIDLPPQTAADEVERLQDEIGAWVPANSRFATEVVTDGDGSDTISLIWLAAILLFLMFGTIIVAAFATIARGQLVLVGQLAANGAEPRFVQRLGALQGFWVGCVGVLIGGLGTLVTLPVTTALIKASFVSPVISIAWSPIDMIVIGAIGIAVATAAAALPALALVKISVLDALAGRRPEHPVPRWMVPVGVATSGLGLLLLTTSATSTSGTGTAGAMIGALGIAVGVCLIGPLIIQVVGRASAVMPLSLRIALRGLGRARLRSSAVVASIAVTTGVMAVIIAGLQANTGGPVPGELAADIAVVSAFPSLEIRSVDGEALLDRTGAPVSDLPAELDTVRIRWAEADTSSSLELVRGVLPRATEHPIRAAVRPDGVYDNSSGRFVRQLDADLGEFEGSMSGEIPPGVGPIEEIESIPLIADDATLAMFSLPKTFSDDLNVAGYGLAVNARDCDDELGWDQTWDGMPIDAPADDAAGLEPARFVVIPVAGLRCWTSVGPFMTERFAVEHGYQIESAGTVFTNTAPLTSAERNRLTGGSAYPSAFVGWDFAGVVRYGQPPAVESSIATRSYSTIWPGISTYEPPTNADDLALAQLILLGIATVFVTLIAAVGLGLAAADSRRDRAVMSVIGARPSTQRRVAAANAWVLVIVGTALGVPTALFAARVVTVTSKMERTTGVPWSFVAAEFVAVPLVVTILAYAASWLRRPNEVATVLQAD